jgi:hypothetical protein
VSKSSFYYAAALAAAAGGALRVAVSFTVPGWSSDFLAVLYAVIDLLFLIGLAGWYLSRRENLGTGGAIGFAIAILGIIIIRSTALFSVNGYVFGAITLLIGLAIMNIRTIWRRDGPMSAPLVWLLSLLCAAVSPFDASAAVLSGSLFGLGFVAASADLWRRARTD